MSTQPEIPVINETYFLRLLTELFASPLLIHSAYKSVGLPPLAEIQQLLTETAVIKSNFTIILLVPLLYKIKLAWKAYLADLLTRIQPSNQEFTTDGDELKEAMLDTDFSTKYNLSLYEARFVIHHGYNSARHTIQQHLQA